MDIPGLLFSYLADSIFYEVQHLQMSPVKHIPLRYLKTINNKNVESTADAKKGLYRLYDGFNTENGASKRTISYKRLPSPYAFRGSVVLLTDGGTFSAAAYFTALFGQYKRGDILGAPTAGSIRQITAGHLLNYELPNTRIRVTVPLAKITFGERLYNSAPKYFAIPFSRQYQYFLKKLDWGKALNVGTKR
jgi:hypothetical protein